MKFVISLVGHIFLSVSALLSCTVAAEPQTEAPADYWRAWANVSASPATIVVEGIYKQGGNGLVAQLHYAVPQGINPKILLLDLKLQQLPGIWTQQILPIPVMYSQKPYVEGQYEGVQIRYPDGNIVSIEKITEFDGWQTAGPSVTPAEKALVGKITAVEITIQKTNPPNLVVTATGEVPTGGFSEAELIRVQYVVPPEDGMQDYYLYAEPPAGLAPQVISLIEATNTWKEYTEEADWLKGVRIHGTGGGIIQKMISEK